MCQAKFQIQPNILPMLSSPVRKSAQHERTEAPKRRAHWHGPSKLPYSPANHAAPPVSSSQNHARPVSNSQPKRIPCGAFDESSSSCCCCCILARDEKKMIIFDFRKSFSSFFLFSGLNENGSGNQKNKNDNNKNN
jgi:hypothetical protein